ncbi:MAG: hypothetical protein U0169_17075 [Polyangiaceae bacterium]
MRRRPVRSPLFARMFAGSLVLASMVGSVGCSSGDSGAEGEDVVAGDAEGAATSVTLTLAGSLATHDLTVSDAPRLVTSATADWTCGADVEHDGKVRTTCTRDSETLDLVYTRATKKAVALHKPAGPRVDRKTFFACTAKGTVRAGALPKTLTCSSASASRPGGLSSPFASTVTGISIPNTHVVGVAGNGILRGMAPRNDAELRSLVDAGVSAVLVFKNQTGTGHDVADEMRDLVAAGLDADDVVNVPFQWKDLTGFRETCEQTVEGLAFLRSRIDAGKKTFFHCTVGEDRTGYLAALHRMLDEGGDAKTLFEEEMCERGYGSGNPTKPYRAVVEKLDSELTPVYTKMAFLIRSGALTKTNLDPSVCGTDPATNATFRAAADLKAQEYRCAISTDYTLP